MVSLINMMKEGLLGAGRTGSRGDIQQYQNILLMPAFLKSVYKVGIVGYRLCAELRRVPPCFT